MDLKSIGCKAVPVRVRPRVLVEKPPFLGGFFLSLTLPNNAKICHVLTGDCNTCVIPFLGAI